MLKNLLIDCNKLFDAKVWQSIAGANSLNNFFISKIAWCVTPKEGGVYG